MLSGLLCCTVLVTFACTICGTALPSGAWPRSGCVSKFSCQLLRGVAGEVTDRADETKARADAPAGDAVPRLQKCKVHTARLHLAFQTRSKKLEPLSIWAILQLKQLASSRRAAPPTWSTPSTAPARSAALCHRLTRVLRSQATRLWPRQPPLSTSQAHDSLPTHHAHADTSRFALYDDCSSHVGRYR